MKAHLSYLQYILRHKWFVFVECCRLGIPWLGITHDLSKFLLSEWKPYVRWFYGNKDNLLEFATAWLHHQNCNPHHWEYWVARSSHTEGASGTVDGCLPMPDKYRREMLADLRGTGRVKTGADDTVTWYAANKDKMQLHPETREWIEAQL